MNTTMNRRRFLGHAAAASGGLVLHGAITGRALAQTAIAHRFVFAYFEGGWDILLGLDPRDPSTTRPDVELIDPGYDQLSADYQRRGVQTAGNLRFGPVVPDAFLTHAPDVSIINGVGMDTAAHEVGRRYFITGRFPRGISAVGSSTPAEILAQLSDDTPDPPFVGGGRSLRDGTPGVRKRAFHQCRHRLERGIYAFHGDRPGGSRRRTRLPGRDAGLRLHRARPRRPGQYGAPQSGTRPYVRRIDPESGVRPRAHGCSDGHSARPLRHSRRESSQPDSPEVLAFVAGQALKEGVSQAVSVRVAQGLDTHANWAQDQPDRQARGWQALAALIADLKATPDGDGTSMWENTTLVAFSEFARTPLFNGLRGRDHFLGNSCLVAGPGLKRGVTIGGSANVGMMPLYTELSSGAAIATPAPGDLDSGRVVTLSPKHVLTTVLTSVGLDPSYLRSAPISALLA